MSRSTLHYVIKLSPLPLLANGAGKQEAGIQISSMAINRTFLG
jgi:hypothetical protein